ncbi:MAG: sialidase family protein [Bacteroidota bacterium]
MRIIVLFFFVVLLGCQDQLELMDNIPAGKGSAEPSLTISDQGLILTWIEAVDDDFQLKMSIYNGEAWTDPKTIASGNDWFVNWADFPNMTVNGSKLFTFYLEKSAPETFSYDVIYVTSPDSGKTWSAPQKLHEDTIAAEHGFVSAVPYKDGFYASWLDGRHTPQGKPMSLRGTYINVEGIVHESVEIDSMTCDCCQTAMTIVNGEPWTFYRDRSPNEVRDIYYSKFDGDKWAKPKSINNDNWEIAACPVNGPRVIYSEDNVAVVWFTAAEGKGKVKMMISDDKGESFGDVIIVDEDNSLGRVDIQMNDERIYVTYLDRKDYAAIIALKIYDHSGNLLDEPIITHVSPERATGFPRSIIWKDQLYVTWTDAESKLVKVATFKIA